MSTRGTIESLIRDKLSVVFIVLYLLYNVLFEVETILQIIRLLGLAVLVIAIIYENHRHIEKLGNTEKSKDLIVEFKDHLNKELQRFEKNDGVVEESEESEELTLGRLFFEVLEKFLTPINGEHAAEEPVVESTEEPVVESTEEPVEEVEVL